LFPRYTCNVPPAPLARFPSRAVWAWLAVAVCAYFLFFFNLSGVGLVGPDESRYASIGREMAHSGDWLTPRLWGEAWFEKPPLLYWMTALGFAAGLSDELAPRLPVALLSVAFLWFYWRRLEREFGQRVAVLSTLVLATTAGWISFSHAATTDLPLAATFSAAMLLALPWLERGERRGLMPASALLAAAVLAKGLVPLVLALPLFWMGRKRWRDLLPPALVFFALATPWYALMALRHGSAFLNDFFLTQHLERFTTSALQHEQPFWFYAPVLLAGLLPWSPMFVLLFRKRLYSCVRRRFLLFWAAFGFVFFSASLNKLPGYLLPLVPAIAALIGLALAEAKNAKWLLAASAAMLVLIPVVADVLPEALVRGLTQTRITGLPWLALVPVSLLAAGVWATERRVAAAGAIAAAMVAGIVWLEFATFPTLDHTASARGLWQELTEHRARVCVGDVNRGWRYNLNYYSVTPLPDCAETPRPIRIENGPNGAPQATRD
jgi:4-amino-4-deoxy-L-arabinose transferase-like glycosyltransferase